LSDGKLIKETVSSSHRNNAGTPMEKEKGMPWIAFVGCILAVASLPLVLALSSVLAESSGGYRAQPLADVAAFVMLVVGIALIYTGLGKKGAKV